MSAYLCSHCWRPFVRLDEMQDHLAHCRLVYSYARDLGLSVATAGALADFAKAMADKLRAAELKHGWQDGWREADPALLRGELTEHVAKGDPRDVANLCLFLSARGEKTA